MAKPTAPETVALIRALRAKDLTVTEIAQGTGVSEATVRRYLDMLPDGAVSRKHEAMRPLFDPRRDDSPDMPLTARLCGDPLPGRRQMIDANRGKERGWTEEPE